MASPPLARRRPAALYIHIPFCARVCPYCDFAVSDQRPRLEADYLEALALEARRRLPAGFKPRTIFIGGGTPSELSAAGLERLHAIIEPHLGRQREWSIEANPGTLTENKLARLVAMGITRVSLGSQSLDDRALARLGRSHRAHHTRAAVERLRAAGLSNINLDILFAIPGQTLAELDAELDAVLALDVPHLSAYGLTYEEGTPFEQARRAGRLSPVENAIEAAMFRRIARVLSAAGYRHYEVSNYARPGAACAHNRVYWRNGAYIGIGNSAASHLRGRRATNERDLSRYIARVRRSGRAIAEVEDLGFDSKVGESAYLALRSARGLDPQAFQRDLGLDPIERFRPIVDKLLEGGFLERRGPAVRLSSRGLLIADRIAMEFLEA